MKFLQLTCLALAGGCLLTGCADDPPPPPRRPPAVVYREGPPPPPPPTVVVEDRSRPPAIIEEVPPPRPRYAVVYVRGHWRWNGHRWVWMHGHYRPA